MEIRKDYHEVLSVLEGVLLHIFRGIESMFLYLAPWSGALTNVVVLINCYRELRCRNRSRSFRLSFPRDSPPRAWKGAALDICRGPEAAS